MVKIYPKPHEPAPQAGPRIFIHRVFHKLCGKLHRCLTELSSRCNACNRRFTSPSSESVFAHPRGPTPSE